MGSDNCLRGDPVGGGGGNIGTDPGVDPALKGNRHPAPDGRCD